MIVTVWNDKRMCIKNWAKWIMWTLFWRKLLVNKVAMALIKEWVWIYENEWSIIQYKVSDYLSFTDSCYWSKHPIVGEY